jgi:hypothetical protein
VPDYPMFKPRRSAQAAVAASLTRVLTELAALPDDVRAEFSAALRGQPSAAGAMAELADLVGENPAAARLLARGLEGRDT